MPYHVMFRSMQESCRFHLSQGLHFADGLSAASVGRYRAWLADVTG